MKQVYKKKKLNLIQVNLFQHLKDLFLLSMEFQKKIEQKEKILKGPKVGSPPMALEGFIKSNNLNKQNIYKKILKKESFILQK